MNRSKIHDETQPSGLTLTSQFFCPSFAKLSKHYREGGLCRQIQVQKAGVGRKGLEAPPAGPRVGSAPKVANPVPQTPIWIDDKEVTEDMNIDETENSPRVPGRKRARDLEGIEGDDLFSEELASQLFNQGGRQNDKLVVDDMGFKEEREKIVITQCKETLKESLEKLSALQQFISQVKREIEQAVI